MRRLLTWSVAACASLVATQVEAADCKVAVGSTVATIQLTTGVRSFNQGLHTASCDPPAKVISGSACFFIDDIGSGQAICVNELSVERRVPSSMSRSMAGPSNAPASASAGKQSMFAAFMDEAEGRVRKTQGGKKAQGADALAGFPYGEILLPQGEFVVSTKAVEGPVSAFVIEDKTARKKLSTSFAGNSIRIPGRDIVAGHSYAWTATVAGAPRTGSFSVTTLADEPDLSAELAMAAKSADVAGNPVALAVRRALVLYEHQFVFDAIRAIDGVAPR